MDQIFAHDVDVIKLINAVEQRVNPHLAVIKSNVTNVVNQVEYQKGLNIAKADIILNVIGLA